MPSFAKLAIPVQATSSAGGAITFNFPPVPDHLVWRGSVFVDQANSGASFRITVGGVPWGTTQGGTALLVEATGLDTIQIVGSNVTATTTFQAWLVGSSVIEEVPAEVGYFNPFPGTTH